MEYLNTYYVCMYGVLAYRTCILAYPGRKNAVFRQMMKNQSIVNVLFTCGTPEVVWEHE